MTVRCPRCGTESLTSSQWYCRSCGEPLPLAGSSDVLVITVEDEAPSDVLEVVEPQPLPPPPPQQPTPAASSARTTTSTLPPVAPAESPLEVTPAPPSIAEELAAVPDLRPPPLAPPATGASETARAPDVGPAALSDQPRPAASFAVPAASRAGAPLAVVVLALAAAASLVIGSLLDYVTWPGDGAQLFGAGARMVVLILLTAGALVTGGLAATTRRAASGLAGGAGAVSATLIGRTVDVFGDFGGTELGAGFYILALGCVLGIGTFLASLGATARSPSERPVNTAVVALGTLSAVALVLGIMLPPPESGVTFAVYNFGEEPDTLTTICYLAFLGAVLMTAAGGFLSARRWGLFTALGAMLVVGWVLSAVIADIGDEDQTASLSSVFSDDLHPLVGVAAAAVVVLILVGFLTSIAPATRSVPYQQPTRPAAPTSPPSVSTSPAASASVPLAALQGILDPQFPSAQTWGPGAMTLNHDEVSLRQTAMAPGRTVSRPLAAVRDVDWMPMTLYGNKVEIVVVSFEAGDAPWACICDVAQAQERASFVAAAKQALVK